jgi:hypothetical protein
MLNELKTAIASHLAADSTLTALLASPSSIFCRRPPAVAALSFITLSASEKPDLEPDARGKHDAELRIDAYSESAATNDAIVAALDASLFDAHRTGALDTTNYRVAFCRRLSSRTASSDVRQTLNREVEKRETLWRMVLLKKNA